MYILKKESALCKGFSPQPYFPTVCIIGHTGTVLMYYRDTRATRDLHKNNAPGRSRIKLLFLAAKYIFYVFYANM